MSENSNDNSRVLKNSNSPEASESILSPVENLDAQIEVKKHNPALNGQEGVLKTPFYFLNIYKPKGITSFDVIYKLRKRLNIKKIGHSGTLDPLADGVMQVAVGSATRLLDYLSSDKTYRAKVKFGYVSTTGDAEGEITEAKTPNFTQNDLKDALKSMTGAIEQVPPIYSAIKVNGKKLCDLARKNMGQDVEIPKRIVTIYEAKIASESQVNKNLQNFTEPFEIELEISCSKGTYIRTFAMDLAQKLGTGAYLTALTRTKAGNFALENSVKIEEISADTSPKIHAISPLEAINLQKYALSFEEYKLVLNGVAFAPETFPKIREIASKNPQPLENTPLALVFENNLVSIGVLSDNKIVCKKVFKT